MSEGLRPSSFRTTPAAWRPAPPVPSARSPLTVTTAWPTSRHVVVHARGDLDPITAPDLVHALDQAIDAASLLTHYGSEGAPTGVVCDIRAVEALRVSGLRVLVDADRIARGRSVSLQVVAKPTDATLLGCARELRIATELPGPGGP